MKHLRKIPTMKARNVEEMEKVRRSRRSSILHQKRFHKYNTVQSYLEEAMNDPQEIQNILDDVPIIAKDMSSGVFEMQQAAVYKMQFLIVTLDNNNNAMNALVEREIISHLLRFLESGDDNNVKIAGAEVLLEVVNGFPLQVIDHGGADTIVSLLGSSHNRVKVEAMRAMACASFLPLPYRDELIANGAITQLAALVEPLLINANVNAAVRVLLLLNALRALSSLCSGVPAPAVHQVEFLVPIVRRIIAGVNPFVQFYYEICKDACLTLCYILRTLAADQVLEYVNEDLSQRLIWLMQYASQDLFEAVHQIVRRLIWSSRASIQVFIDQGLHLALNYNLSQAPAFQLEACKTIDRTIFCDPAKIQQILFDGKMIWRLVGIIQEEEIGRHELKMEAISVLSGTIRGGTEDQIAIMCNFGCIELLCYYLNMTETRALCIRALKDIIQAGNRNRVHEVNVYAAAVAHFGRDIISTLINNEGVEDIANWILNNIN